MFTLAALLFVGCGVASPDELAEEDGDEPADAIAVAFAGCTSTRLDMLNDEAYATATVTYDANGDGVTGSNEYAEWADYGSTWVATYGAPHELTSQTVTYPNFGEYDYTYVADWADGQLLYTAYDMGADADLDNEQWYEYDGADLVHYELDNDGDGVLDESADCTSVAEGAGTRITCEGTTAGGALTADRLLDAEGRLLEFDSADASGAESHGAWFEYGPAGESGDRERQEKVAFVLTYEDTTTVEFDAAGRRSHQLNTQVDHTLEDANTTFEYTYTYDCP